MSYGSLDLLHRDRRHYFILTCKNNHSLLNELLLSAMNILQNKVINFDQRQRKR